jgi:S1-C subfamily serine protease
MMQDIMKNDREARTMIVPRGVVISAIDPGSPAESRLTELNRRYVITAVNDRPTPHPDDFEEATTNARKVRLRIARVGDISGRTFEVTLP